MQKYVKHLVTMDFIYFLRSICKEKHLCFYPETVLRKRGKYSRGVRVTKDFNISWINKTTEFGFRRSRNPGMEKPEQRKKTSDTQGNL